MGLEIRSRCDDELIDTEIAVVDGFWQCQT